MSRKKSVLHDLQRVINKNERVFTVPRDSIDGKTGIDIYCCGADKEGYLAFPPYLRRITDEIARLCGIEHKAGVVWAPGDCVQVSKIACDALSAVLFDEPGAIQFQCLAMHENTKS